MHLCEPMSMVDAVGLRKDHPLCYCTTIRGSGVEDFLKKKSHILQQSPNFVPGHFSVLGKDTPGFPNISFTTGGIAEASLCVYVHIFFRVRMNSASSFNPGQTISSEQDSTGLWPPCLANLPL